MGELTPPIIVDGDGDFAVHATIDDAISSVEAIDVADGLYEVFDSNGYRLQIAAHGERVSIQLDTASQPDPNGLARRARAHIELLGAGRVDVERPEDAALPVLLDALLRFERDFRERPRRSPWKLLSNRLSRRSRAL